MEVKTVKFICEEPECHFESYTERDAKQHHNSNHTYKSYTNISICTEYDHYDDINEICFLYFETEDNYKLFTDAKVDKNKVGKFVGPGWYGMHSCDSADYWYTAIYHSSKYIKHLEENMNNIKNMVEEVKNLTGD